VVIPNQHVPVLLFLLMTLCLSRSITVELGTLLRPSKNMARQRNLWVDFRIFQRLRPHPTENDVVDDR
jgi:hypothetical protein